MSKEENSALEKRKFSPAFAPLHRRSPQRGGRERDARTEGPKQLLQRNVEAASSLPASVSAAPSEPALACGHCPPRAHHQRHDLLNCLRGAGPVAPERRDILCVLIRYVMIGPPRRPRLPHHLARSRSARLAPSLPIGHRRCRALRRPPRRAKAAATSSETTGSSGTAALLAGSEDESDDESDDADFDPDDPGDQRTRRRR